MAKPEVLYSVELYDEPVGMLVQVGDYTRFRLNDDYVADSNRNVLGLAFEDNLRQVHSSALRLPPWFSNLLPEGPLRQWIADDRGVSPDREMELLARVGRDLPGAVTIVPAPEDAEGWKDLQEAKDLAFERQTGLDSKHGLRFSLAGVALKFSMLQAGDRLTLPAVDELGRWIVKLPDPIFAGLPINEFAMMKLARLAGMIVPDVSLRHRDTIELPDSVWKNNESLAYVVRRFDRTEAGARIHIEDFAQIRNVYPWDKYRGSFETIANLCYRGQDVESLREFTRRLAFAILIQNGDAHLKNWSMIYKDKRRPSLAPAYDLVATAAYPREGYVEDLALPLDKTRRFSMITASTFERLDKKLGASADLSDVVVETVKAVSEKWPEVEAEFKDYEEVRTSISLAITEGSRSLLRLLPSN